MNINIVDGIKPARELTGHVVIIDTFRASNTILAILDRGAEIIYIPSSQKQTGALRSTHPDSLYFAESMGDKLREAHHDNSPSQAYSFDLTGKIIILYTSRGSKAISAPKKATEILIASFGNAQVIADYLVSASPNNLTFVSCGEPNDKRAMEDYECARYIQSLIEGNPLDYDSIRERISSSPGAERLRNKGQANDLELCLRLNYSKIVPKAERRNGVVVVRGIDKGGY